MTAHLLSDDGMAHVRFQRVLVTGATGFLGKPLVERLALHGYTVTAVGRRQAQSPFDVSVEYVRGDLSDATIAMRLFEPWRWDAVINLAGPVPNGDSASDDAYDVLEQHLNIALNVCLALPAMWSGRLIHASSMVVYGIPERLPVDETHPRRPINSYGAAKMLSEDVVLAFARGYSVDCWVLRFPGLFSEVRQSGALFHFMRAAAEGRPLVVSAPQPVPWDVLHAADAIEAIVWSLAVGASHPGVINVSYGCPVELVTIAKQIAARAGADIQVENRTGVRHPLFRMDISKARRLLHWPPTTLEARLDEMWRTIVMERRIAVSR